MGISVHAGVVHVGSGSCASMHFHTAVLLPGVESNFTVRPERTLACMTHTLHVHVLEGAVRRRGRARQVAIAALAFVFGFVAVVASYMMSALPQTQAAQRALVHFFRVAPPFLLARAPAWSQLDGRMHGIAVWGSAFPSTVVPYPVSGALVCGWQPRAFTDARKGSTDAR